MGSRSAACGPARSPGQGRVDVGAAAADGPDRPRQVVERRLLDQEPARAGVESLQQERALAVAGVEDDRGRRPFVAELASDVDPAHARHADVHDGDVRRVLRDQPQRLVAVLRLRDDLHVVDVREISRDGVDDRGVIVGDDAAVPHAYSILVASGPQAR